MKTSRQTILLFVTCFALCLSLQAQHTEIEYDSGGNDPQLLLNETAAGFSRLTMQNTAPGHWTLAARNGPSATDSDFNIFYDDGTTGVNIINIDADGNKTNFNSAIEVLDEDVTISGTDPDLILSSDGTNDPAILFGDNGGSADSRIWYDSSEDVLKMGTGTTFGNINVDGGGKVGIAEDDLSAQLTVKANAGTIPTPATLDLAENNNSGYPVLRYTNFNIPGSFTAEANSAYSGALSGNADYRIRFSEDGTEANKKDILSAVYAYKDHTGINLSNAKDERVGIRTAAPLTDLHLVHKNGISGHGFRIEHEGSNNRWWKMYVSDGTGTLSFRNDASPNSNVGTFATNGTYTASDIRLKRDIEDAPYGLAEVMRMDAKTYHYKSDKKDAQKSIGFIAQDINEISPELVLYDAEADQYSLNYAAINVIAIKAIQEQQEIIEDKINDINDLKSEMASLRAMIEDIKSDK